MTKSELIKITKEYEDLLAGFDTDYYEDKSEDELTDNDIRLMNDIDNVYKSLRRLRLQLDRMKVE